MLGSITIIIMAAAISQYITWFMMIFFRSDNYSIFGWRRRLATTRLYLSAFASFHIPFLILYVYTLFGIICILHIFCCEYDWEIFLCVMDATKTKIIYLFSFSLTSPYCGSSFLIRVDVKCVLIENTSNTHGNLFIQ